MIITPFFDDYNVHKILSFDFYNMYKILPFDDGNLKDDY